MRRRLEPLRVRPFGRLLGSYTINDLGDSIGVVALSILVYDRTESVAPTAGFFLVAKFLPALLATGLTAHLDRFDLRKTLTALYAVEALAFAALAFLADGDRFFLPLVLALGLLDGTLAITGRGLTRGAVGVLLKPKDLISEGNALMNLGFAAASVFGAALAGGLIALWGVSVALLVDAASFAVIAIIIAAAKDLPQPEHEDRTPWHERYVDGLEFARDNRLVRTLLIGQSLALVCFTIVVPIEVIYAKESLKTTDAGFGLLLSSWGAGIVVGSLLFLWLKNKAGLTMILISSAAVGFAYLGMAQAQTLAVACIASVVRRRRQRRAVGGRDDAAAGGHAVRVSGPHVGPAGVARGRRARRRLPARRHDRRARLAAHRVRRRRRRDHPARPRRRGDPPRTRIRLRRPPARPWDAA